MRFTASMNRPTRSMATARTTPGCRRPARRLSPARKPAVDAGADRRCSRSARCFAGQLFHGVFLEAERAPEFWHGSIAFSEHLAHAAHEVPLLVKLSATIAMLLGLWIAWNNYIRNPGAAAAFVRQFPAVHRFVRNKWYFDELFDLLFVRPSLWLGRLFWKGGDEGTIDRFGPHGAAYAVGVGNRITARLQSGYLYSYALVMLLGLIGAASWAIWWAQ